MPDSNLPEVLWGGGGPDHVTAKQLMDQESLSAASGPVAMLVDPDTDGRIALYSRKRSLSEFCGALFMLRWWWVDEHDGSEPTVNELLEYIRQRLRDTAESSAAEVEEG